MDTNAQTSNWARRTPVWEAVENNKPEAIACLYKYGANISLQSTANDGGFYTPLDYVKRLQNRKQAQSCLELLSEFNKVKQGNDVNALNACTIPISSGVVASFLSLANINCGTMLMKACYEGFFYLANIILEEPRTRVDTKGPQGNTALHYAAEKGHIKIVELLLNKKKDIAIDVNNQNDDGNTALHLALMHGHQAAADLLIERGANTGIKNKKDTTPESLMQELATKKCHSIQ